MLPDPSNCRFLKVGIIYAATLYNVQRFLFLENRLLITREHESIKLIHFHVMNQIDNP